MKVLPSDIQQILATGAGSSTLQARVPVNLTAAIRASVKASGLPIGVVTTLLLRRGFDALMAEEGFVPLASPVQEPTPPTPSPPAPSTPPPAPVQEAAPAPTPAPTPAPLVPVRHVEI